MELLTRNGFSAASAEAVLVSLEGGGMELADRNGGELVCRWIDVNERAVPPDADTIIRTVTRTTADQAISRTHWLEGIEAPPF